MEQKKTLMDMKTILHPTMSTNRGCRLFYGMTILIALADAFYRRGCCLENISEKSGLHISDLEPVVACLEKAGLLGRHPENWNWLFLQKEPVGQWILEVLPNLKQALEEG